MMQGIDVRCAASRLAGGALAVMLMAGSGFALQDGLKLTEQFIKASGETVKAITETRIQITKTLDVYNSLSADGDRRKIYGNLLKELDNCDKRVEGVRTRTAAMNGASSSYFEERGKSLEAITSDDLRARGQERLTESKTAYANVLELGQAAGVDYQAFMSKLRDQVLFLGHDLNPDAVASLDEDTKKVNDTAAELFAKIDGTVTAFNTYSNSLRPE